MLELLVLAFDLFLSVRALQMLIDVICPLASVLNTFISFVSFFRKFSCLPLDTHVEHHSDPLGFVFVLFCNIQEKHNHVMVGNLAGFFDHFLCFSFPPLFSCLCLFDACEFPCI